MNCHDDFILNMQEYDRTPMLFFLVEIIVKLDLIQANCYINLFPLVRINFKHSSEELVKVPRQQKKWKVIRVKNLLRAKIIN